MIAILLGVYIVKSNETKTMCLNYIGLLLFTLNKAILIVTHTQKQNSLKTRKNEGKSYLNTPVI